MGSTRQETTVEPRHNDIDLLQQSIWSLFFACLADRDTGLTGKVKGI
jgi:hypothetical protein